MDRGTYRLPVSWLYCASEAEGARSSASAQRLAVFNGRSASKTVSLVPFDRALSLQSLHVRVGPPAERAVFCERCIGSDGGLSGKRARMRTLSRPGWPDFILAFDDDDEIGPRMPARIAKQHRAWAGQSIAGRRASVSTATGRIHATKVRMTGPHFAVSCSVEQSRARMPASRGSWSSHFGCLALAGFRVLVSGPGRAGGSLMFKGNTCVAAAAAVVAAPVLAMGGAGPAMAQKPGGTLASSTGTARPACRSTRRRPIRSSSR